MDCERQPALSDFTTYFLKPYKGLCKNNISARNDTTN